MTRFLISSSALILSAAMFVSTPVTAQQGLPGIFEDIFGGNKGNAPFGSTTNAVYIETIPLNVTFDARADLLPPEATLIVTAIAPAPPNVRRAKPLVIGETRLLISRLAPPLQMVIAVPSDMAREIDYAVIEARIVDANGNTTHRLNERVEYAGAEPPFLNLIPEGALTQSIPHQGSDPYYGQPSTPPVTGPHTSPQPYTPQPHTPSQTGQQLASISGLALINGTAPILRGGKLIVRVYENALAGGLSNDAISEEIIDIDNRHAPYDFQIFVPLGADGRLESPEIEAYIQDWAGRKTHVMRGPIPFTTDAQNNARVSLNLDSIVSGSEAVPADRVYIPPASALTTVKGTAKIFAPRGLPAGSTLVVDLVDAQDISRQIEQSRVPLDGLSGDVPFNFSVETSKLRLTAGDPLLNGRVETQDGKVLLSSRALVTLSDTDAQLDLQPTELY